MLLDALGRALNSEIATFAVIVDAKDDAAVAFYAAYDFMPLTAAGRRQFIPMTEVARLLAG
jgi:hypothetical protein